MRCELPGRAQVVLAIGPAVLPASRLSRGLARHALDRGTGCCPAAFAPCRYRSPGHGPRFLIPFISPEVRFSLIRNSDGIMPSPTEGLGPQRNADETMGLPQSPVREVRELPASDLVLGAEPPPQPQRQSIAG